MGYGITAEQAMTRKPISISPGRSLAEAGNMMLREDVRSLVVMESGKLVGIITEKDLVREVAKNRKDLSGTKVEDVMSRTLITILPDTDLYDVAKFMNEKGIRRMLVVDKDKNFLGLITEKDLLKIQPSIIEILLEKVKLREPKTELSAGPRKTSGDCESCGNYSDSLVQSKGVQICENCADEIVEE